MRVPRFNFFARRSRSSLGYRFSQSFIGRLFHKLSKREQVIVSVLAVVVVIAGTALGISAFKKLLIEEKGGTYIEGIVAASPADVEPAVQALTNISLLSSNPDGTLVGQLVESWTMNDAATVVELQLRSNVDRNVVLKAIDPTQKNSPFVGTTIEPFDEHGIRIRLKESFSPFIATLTKPLIPLGPYIVSDRTKEMITLVSRPDYYLGEPILNTVELQIFPTNDSLQQALDHNSIDGVSQIPADVTLPVSFATYNLQLSRKTAAFFNLGRDVVKDINVRQNLIERKAFDTQLNLNVVTTESLATTPAVQKLLNDWAADNVRVALTVLSSAKVQTDIIPARNYDVLIFGIDLGADPDPYPFWHSSQRSVTGLNLSNFADVNADKLLEQARKTGKADDRTKLYAQFNQILDTQKPWTVLDTPSVVFAVDKTFVGPMSQSGFYATDRFKNISTWYIKR